MKRWIPGVLFLVLPYTSNAAITFEQLAQISVAPEILEGQFSQEKYLSALDAGLVSSGKFKYERGNSIHWEILQPIRNKLIMTPDGISNQQDGSELLQLDINTNPTVAVLSEIFFAVLTAEWEKLARYFELSGTIDGEQWHAVLIPLDQAARQVFSQVELKGETLLKEIILHETSGDKTTIRLDNQR